MPGPDTQHTLGLVIIPVNSSSCFSALCTDIFKKYRCPGPVTEDSGSEGPSRTD